MPRRLLIATVCVLILGGCASEPAAVRAAPPPPSPAPLVEADPQPALAATTQPVAARATVEQAPVAEPQAPAPPMTLLERFDAQLLALTSNAAAADESFASLPADERNLLTTVIDSLGRFRVALGNPQGLLSEKAEPLINLAAELNAQAPLSLPTVALCRKVTQFGVYDPIEPARFPAGQETPTIVYCEVEHFRSEPATEGYQAKLSYEAVLYSDADHSVSVITRKPADVIDICRNRRRDFFLADRLTLPASLPVGRYLLKVTVVDQIANRVAEKTIPIVIAAD